MQEKRRASMRSEAHNTDCIEFMRSLPDKCFSLAVCDPPYGKGNDESLVGGYDSDRDSTNISIPAGARITAKPTSKRFGGCFRRYYTPIQRSHMGNEIQNCWGGVNPKHRNGMSPLRRSSSMNFSVSAAIR